MATRLRERQSSAEAGQKTHGHKHDLCFFGFFGVFLSFKI